MAQVCLPVAAVCPTLQGLSTVTDDDVLGSPRLGGGLAPARRAGPDQPDRPGPAHPDTGPDGHASADAQPGCHPSQYSPALPSLTDIVRDLRQAPAPRGSG